jgi:hypothetical protein
MESLIATALFGRFGGAVWGLLGISCIMAGLFLWIGAHLAGLKYVTLGRALLAAVAAWTVTWLCAGMLASVPVAGTTLGVLIGLFLSWFVIRQVLNTSLGPALLVWGFDVFAHAIATLLGLTLGGIRIAMPHFLG